MPEEPYVYTGMVLEDLRPAQTWTPGNRKMSGVQANRHIFNGYHALDYHFGRYLGEPALSSWLTFAKYAAREVGSWVRGVEGLLCLLLRKGEGLSYTRRLLDAHTLMEVARADGLLDPFSAVAMKWLSGYQVRPALLANTRRLLRVLPGLLKVVWDVRNGLVEGNTVLYHRMAYAFDLFLRTEAEGLNGLVVLHRHIRAGGLEDPMGYLRAGFALYREAHLLGQMAHISGLPRTRRLILEFCRRQLVLDANLCIAVQEQALVLQTANVFSHPVLRGLLGAVTPGRLYLTLAALPGGGYQRFELVPDGGNWADFETRMGFREVEEALHPEDAFVVLFPGEPSGTRYYVADESRRGTILDLFTQYLDGPHGELLRRGRPRDINPALYDD